MVQYHFSCWKWYSLEHTLFFSNSSLIRRNRDRSRLSVFTSYSLGLRCQNTAIQDIQIRYPLETSIDVMRNVEMNENRSQKIFSTRHLWKNLFQVNYWTEIKRNNYSLYEHLLFFIMKRVSTLSRYKLHIRLCSCYISMCYMRV